MTDRKDEQLDLALVEEVVKVVQSVERATVLVATIFVKRLGHKTAVKVEPEDIPISRKHFHAETWRMAQHEVWRLVLQHCFPGTADEDKEFEDVEPNPVSIPQEFIDMIKRLTKEKATKSDGK